MGDDFQHPMTVTTIGKLSDVNDRLDLETWLNDEIFGACQDVAARIHVKKPRKIVVTLEFTRDEFGDIRCAHFVEAKLPKERPRVTRATMRNGVPFTNKHFAEVNQPPLPNVFPITQNQA